MAKKLDRRNLLKRLLLLGIIQRLDEQRNIGPRRAPFLYRFDNGKYDKALGGRGCVGVLRGDGEIYKHGTPLD